MNPITGHPLRFKGIYIMPESTGGVSVALTHKINASTKPDEVKIQGWRLGTHPDIGTLTEKWSAEGFVPSENDKVELQKQLTQILESELNSEQGLSTPLPEPGTGRQMVQDWWRSTIKALTLKTLSENILPLHPGEKEHGSPAVFYPDEATSKLYGDIFA